jgi:hypothetical protein
MNRKNRKIIEEIFRYVSSDSILIIDGKGQLRRLYCPFMVIVVRIVHLLREGQIKAVIAVKIAPDLVDVYIIEAKAYYHYNFRIIT